MLTKPPLYIKGRIGAIPTMYLLPNVYKINRKQCISKLAKYFGPNNIVSTQTNIPSDFGYKIPPCWIKSVPQLDTEIIESSRLDLVKDTLAGVATLTNPGTDRFYKLEITTMADQYKSFSGLLADSTAVYGVNLPCDRVFIALPDSIDTSSVIQCLGRSGRTGKYSTSRSHVRYTRTDFETV